jgi:hypothetical protein
VRAGPFHVFVGRTVDAVVRAERGGEDDALLKDGAALHGVGDLKLGVEDVRGVGPDVAAEEVGDGSVGDLFEVLLEVGLGVAPGEVGVALGEAALGERVHDVGAGKGFGEEEGVWRGLEDFGDAPLPEGEGLGVWVVDAEDTHAAVDPELEDAVEGVPQAAPVGGFEVQRIDVLILFWRVFGVLDGAVGALDEPGGMGGDPGVIG